MRWSTTGTRAECTLKGEWCAPRCGASHRHPVALGTQGAQIAHTILDTQSSPAGLGIGPHLQFQGHDGFSPHFTFFFFFFQFQPLLT